MSEGDEDLPLPWRPSGISSERIDKAWRQLPRKPGMADDEHEALIKRAVTACIRTRPGSIRRQVANARYSEEARKGLTTYVELLRDADAVAAKFNEDAIDALITAQAQIEAEARGDTTLWFADQPPDLTSDDLHRAELALAMFKERDVPQGGKYREKQAAADERALVQVIRRYYARITGKEPPLYTVDPKTSKVDSHYYHLISVIFSALGLVRSARGAINRNNPVKRTHKRKLPPPA